jgi:peptidoglycan hydrolase CwlO-like protein
MINFIKSNLIQLLTALVLITFGYANFTKDTQANADDIKELKENKNLIQKDITEIKGDIKTLLERTKKL